MAAGGGRTSSEEELRSLERTPSAGAVAGRVGSEEPLGEVWEKVLHTSAAGVRGRCRVEPRSVVGSPPAAPGLPARTKVVVTEFGPGVQSAADGIHCGLCGAPPNRERESARVPANPRHVCPSCNQMPRFVSLPKQAGEERAEGVRKRATRSRSAPSPSQSSVAGNESDVAESEAGGDQQLSFWSKVQQLFPGLSMRQWKFQGWESLENDTAVVYKARHKGRTKDNRRTKESVKYEHRWEEEKERPKAEKKKNKRPNTDKQRIRSKTSGARKSGTKSSPVSSVPSAASRQDAAGSKSTAGSTRGKMSATGSKKSEGGSTTGKESAGSASVQIQRRAGEPTPSGRSWIHGATNHPSTLTRRERLGRPPQAAASASQSQASTLSDVTSLPNMDVSEKDSLPLPTDQSSSPDLPANYYGAGKWVVLALLALLAATLASLFVWSDSLCSELS